MTQKTELPWIAEASRHIGLTEIPGKAAHNKTLLQWLADMGRYSAESRPWWQDDETPWCGLFVGRMLGGAGRFVVPNWFRASAWNDPSAMHRLDKPAYGCIVTFTRKGGGHVGFVVGKDRAGNLLVLGGNQGNRVSIAAFAPSRVSGYWWPALWNAETRRPVPSVPAPERYVLPVGSAALSRSEA